MIISKKYKVRYLVRWFICWFYRPFMELDTFLEFTSSPWNVYHDINRYRDYIVIKSQESIELAINLGGNIYLRFQELELNLPAIFNYSDRVKREELKLERNKNCTKIKRFIDLAHKLQEKSLDTIIDNKLKNDYINGKKSLTDVINLATLNYFRKGSKK